MKRFKVVKWDDQGRVIETNFPEIQAKNYQLAISLVHDLYGNSFSIVEI